MKLAIEVAKSARRRKDGGRGMHAYRCQSCHGVHIGTLVMTHRRRRPDQVEGFEA